MKGEMLEATILDCQVKPDNDSETIIRGKLFETPRGFIDLDGNSIEYA